MISSKSKKGLAYAKICKDKSGTNLKSSALFQKGRGGQDKKQNIYDELINHLDEEDTDYLNQLITKQEKKSKHSNQAQIMNNSVPVFHQRSNSPSQPASFRQIGMESKKAETKVKNQNGSTSLPVNSCVKSSINSQVYRLTPEKQILHQKNSFNSQTTQQSRCFVNQISDYISELNQQSRVLDKQCRKTHQKISSNFRTYQNSSEQAVKEQQWGIHPAKYNRLLNQLEETLKTNDSLEEKTEFQERKIEEMSKIIASMCCEIDSLKKQLKSEVLEREKYEYAFEDFASKMGQAKSKSKQKNYNSGHAKRFSHIPSSSQLEEDFRQGRSQLKAFIEERKTFDGGFLGKCKEDGYLLKKKGIHSKKKTSQLWRESEILESTVDRFSRNQRYS